MAGAEMTIRLVDGTEAEQAAFNQPATDTGATRADFGYDAKQSLLSVQQSLAALANKTANASEDGGTEQAPGGLDGLTRDDVREWRLALVDLAEKFTPKFFAEPIERLIAALGGDSKATASQTTPIPAVGQIPPRRESNPMGDMFASLQNKLNNTRIGRGVNTAIQGARNLAGRARNVARSVRTAINKTKAGRAVTSMARQAASRVANSGFGKAVAGAGRAAGGAIARAVGTVASGAVASGGTASVAAGSGATAAAGAAGAAALANPVGLAVGAVVAAFASLAIATKVLNDTFSAEADRLEKYSASIAIARGNQRINTELNMIDRARRLGGPLGGLESSKTALNDSMEKLWTEILVILSSWTPVLQTLVDTTTVGVSKATEVFAELREFAARVAHNMALLTPDKKDDDKTNLAWLEAQKDVVAAAQKSADAIDRLMGKNSNQFNGRDPMLMSLLNAKVGP